MNSELLDRLRNLRGDISFGDEEDRFKMFIDESINDREELARQFYFSENAPITVSDLEYTHGNSANMNKIMIEVVEGFENFLDQIMIEQQKEDRRKREAASLLKTIMLLPRPYSQILYLRYYKCFNWRTVCHLVNLERSSYYRKHNKAVDLLEEILEPEKEDIK